MEEPSFTDRVFSLLDIVKVLAFLIIAAWLVSIFLHISTDQTLTNVVMVIVGFFYGSSTGSKTKDDTKNEQAKTMSALVDKVVANGNPSAH